MEVRPFTASDADAVFEFERASEYGLGNEYVLTKRSWSNSDTTAR